MFYSFSVKPIKRVTVTVVGLQEVVFQRSPTRSAQVVLRKCRLCTGCGWQGNTIELTPSRPRNHGLRPGHLIAQHFLPISQIVKIYCNTNDRPTFDPLFNLLFILACIL